MTTRTRPFPTFSPCTSEIPESNRSRGLTALDLSGNFIEISSFGHGTLLLWFQFFTDALIFRTETLSLLLP